MYTTFGWDEKRNAQQLSAIPAIAESCKTLIVAVPSWYEVPDLDDHAAGDALRLAEKLGLRRIILRKVIPTWKGSMKEMRDHWGRFTSPRIFADHGFLAAALARVRAEAARYGASPGAYLEPHGLNALAVWKRGPVYARERRRIALACRRAVSVAGPVDHMLPWGGSKTTHFGYAFANVIADTGQILGNGMYKLRDGKPYNKSNPPLGFGRKNVSPGLFVIPSTNEDQQKYWTPKSLRAWMRSPDGWRAYLKKYPKAELVWVYPGGAVLEVAKLFAEEK